MKNTHFKFILLLFCYFITACNQKKCYQSIDFEIDKKDSLHIKADIPFANGDDLNPLLIDSLEDKLIFVRNSNQIERYNICLQKTEKYAWISSLIYSDEPNQRLEWLNNDYFLLLTVHHLFVFDKELSVLFNPIDSICLDKNLQHYCFEYLLGEKTNGKHRNSFSSDIEEGDIYKWYIAENKLCVKIKIPAKDDSLIYGWKMGKHK